MSEQLPGILGLFAGHMDTAKPMSELAEILLRAPHPTLSQAEREIIAGFVSQLNETEFCAKSHTAFAAAYESNRSESQKKTSLGVFNNKTVVMITLAATVARNTCTEEDRNLAKEEGLTDEEIHTVVLIASAFCMYNRYVKSMGVDKPSLSNAQYAEMAKGIVEKGYLRHKEPELQPEASL